MTEQKWKHLRDSVYHSSLSPKLTGEVMAALDNGFSAMQQLEDWKSKLLTSVKQEEHYFEQLEDCKKPKAFEIDFGGNVLAKIEINNNIPFVAASINGYGERIEKVSVKAIKNTEDEVTRST